MPISSLAVMPAVPVAAPSPGGPVPEQMQDRAQTTVEATGPIVGLVLNMALGVASALALIVMITLVLNVVMRRRPALRQQVARCRVPAAVALSLLAARIALGLSARDEEWFAGVGFLLLGGIVAAVAWLCLRVVRIVEEEVLDKYQLVGEDNRRDRKIQTQTVLLRRVLDALIIVIAVAVILLAIPQVRAVGAGLLASAGVLSVVAGLAVQSTLTNVFAGIQLAFTDAIRVGDVVEVDDTFGTIEDITLSYVVVKIWDGRRVIFPSSHFTTTPFQNWTRTGSELSGTVEMDVDWQVPMDEMRERLHALLESTTLWDRKESSMQVTEAVGGMVRIRAVVSARNSGDLWDLRCLVREDLMTFLRSDHPEGIFAQRMVEASALPLGTGSTATTGSAPAGTAAKGTASGSVPASPGRPGSSDVPHGGPVPGPKTPTSPLTQVRDDSSVFTGSITAVERNREFAGPGEAAYQERRERQEERQEDPDADERDEPSDSGRLMRVQGSSARRY